MFDQNATFIQISLPKDLVVFSEYLVLLALVANLLFFYGYLKVEHQVHFYFPILQSSIVGNSNKSSSKLSDSKGFLTMNNVW